MKKIDEERIRERLEEAIADTDIMQDYYITDRPYIYNAILDQSVNAIVEMVKDVLKEKREV